MSKVIEMLEVINEADWSKFPIQDIGFKWVPDYRDGKAYLPTKAAAKMDELGIEVVISDMIKPDFDF